MNLFRFLQSCRRLLPLMLFATPAAPAFAVPPLPFIPSAVFSATNYGAMGDGATDNTSAIQATINAARTAGGGTVEIAPAALPYRCGPITLYSNINFQVDAGATLQALPFGTYPNSSTAPAHFITINTGSTNVKISGGGTLDGNGAAWWTAYTGKTIVNRPRLVQVNRADTVQITGVTLLNAAMFHLAFSNTHNVTIDGITISAPASSPNTDGIDPAGLHYLIKNCSISVGDDNIAVKPGSTSVGDLTISNCFFGAGHGLSVGGQTNVGLDGMIVDRCTFNGTTSGLRLKADPTQGGPVQNITYSNLTMTNVQYPIVFYSYYLDVGSPGAVSGSSQTTPAKVASWNASPPDSLKSATIPTWKNITLSNITATGATGYSIIWGLPLADALIANVTLDNVRISGTVGLEIYNAQNVRLTGNTSFNVPSGVAPVTTYNALALTSQPQSQTVPPGSTVTFTVGVAGTGGIKNTPPTFQWSFNGNALADGPQSDGSTIGGATTATLTRSNTQASGAGSYTVKVAAALDAYDSTLTTLTPSNTLVSSVSAPAQLSVAIPSASSLINLSVRCTAGTADQTLIVGFVVSGPGKPLLVRAIGPTLTNFGVAGTLADPQLNLYSGTAVISANDNWGSVSTAPAISTAASAVGAFPLADGSLDASLLFTTANGGAYTAQISGANGATGVALAEIYDVAANSGARLTNVAVRARAGAGDQTLIIGFVIGGSAPKTLLLRGAGPALAQFGVSGVLADPQLSVLSATGVVGTNDNWGSAPSSTALAAASAQVGAFAFADGSKDAGLLLTLPPGAYTAQLSGVGGTTGIALVELYEIP